ncbi:MAG: hypothetical protein JJU37_05945 [Balneolaceae bacterium]|nr:hypothetical protein [Balneolaceae bacterium]
MKIVADFNSDVQTQKPKPGSYEWWYFDAQSIDGYSIVVIFYEGNPFSKRYIKGISSGSDSLAEFYPAISISLYKDGKPIFYAFEEFLSSECIFSADKPIGNAGNNSFTGKKIEGEIQYQIMLDQLLENGDSIKGTISFRSGDMKFSLMDSNSEEPSAHVWNLIQPSADVEGTLTLGGSNSEEIHFKGTGYHDHNFGSEPMKDTFDEWYWGRYHLEGLTLVYYLMRVKNRWEKKAWLISEEGKTEAISSSDIEFSAQQMSLFGLLSSRIITFGGNNFKAHLQLDRLTDNGPFYQRFEGRLMATIGDKPVQSRGISEYIKPERIYNKLFWPLVDMRIKYPGKAHWVQKSSMLYRWTW